MNIYLFNNYLSNESNQLITTRLDSYTTRPISLKLVKDNKVYELVFFEKNIGVVWCPSSDCAQVNNVVNDGIAHATGIKSGNNNI